MYKYCMKLIFICITLFKATLKNLVEFDGACAPRKGYLPTSPSKHKDCAGVLPLLAALQHCSHSSGLYKTDVNLKWPALKAAHVTHLCWTKLGQFSLKYGGVAHIWLSAELFGLFFGGIWQCDGSVVAHVWQTGGASVIVPYDMRAGRTCQVWARRISLSRVFNGTFSEVIMIPVPTCLECSIIHNNTWSLAECAKFLLCRE